MAPRPINEADLHAYVDGALDGVRQAEVAAYLELHPDTASEVRGYAQQREALQAALAPIAEEPIPPELNLASLIEARRRPARAAPWRAAAAALLVFGLGGAGGWSLHPGTTHLPASGVAALAQEAAFNYSVYGPDKIHPVEFDAASSGTLVNWISTRLQTRIIVPNLTSAGYHFMGGRLVATAHGPAGMLMYDNTQGSRLVMFVRPMEVDKNLPKMVPYAQGSVAGFSWTRDGIGYSVMGDASADVLHPLADVVREQVTPGI
jgi:anti-sigma factor RsiW